MPVKEVRDYFGENIGIYFEFLDFYSNWLPGMAGVGVIAWLVWWAKGWDDVKSGFALMNMIWAVSFLESWKRRQNEIACAWNVQEFKISQTTRFITIYGHISLDSTPFI